MPHLPADDDIQSGLKPFLAAAMTPVLAARAAGVAPLTRKRPLIFVYDTGSEFATDLLQVRFQYVRVLEAQRCGSEGSEWV